MVAGFGVFGVLAVDVDVAADVFTGFPAVELEDFDVPVDVFVAGASFAVLDADFGVAVTETVAISPPPCDEAGPALEGVLELIAAAASGTTSVKLLDESVVAAAR